MSELLKADRCESCGETRRACCRVLGQARDCPHPEPEHKTTHRPTCGIYVDPEHVVCDCGAEVKA